MRTVRLYHPESLIPSQEVQLSSDASRHLLTVLRANEGQALELFNGDGFAYSAKLVNVQKKSASAYIESKQQVANESPLAIHLYQGISRGDKMDLTIQKAVELGVTQITPITSERCGVKLNKERMQKKLEHWQKVAIAACEQSGRNQVPQVNPLKSFVDVITELGEQGLILNPYAEAGIASLRPSQDWKLLIGPEGGFSDDEIALASKHACQQVHLGPRILRTETAGLAVLACLQAQFGDWR